MSNNCVRLIQATEIKKQEQTLIASVFSTNVRLNLYKHILRALLDSNEYCSRESDTTPFRTNTHSADLFFITPSNSSWTRALSQHSFQLYIIVAASRALKGFISQRREENVL